MSATTAEMIFSKDFYNVDGENTFSIRKVNSNLKTLDEKFIPDTIARVSDLENIDLTPYETKTDAVAKLEEAKAFASEEDAKVQGSVDVLSDKVTTLVGEDTNKSVRTIANEELAKQLIAESAKESLDTLTEIAVWIQSHPDDASAMNKAISDLEALVGALPGDVAATTIVDYIQEVVAANKALIDANTETIANLHTIATSGSWNDLEDKPFGHKDEYVTIASEKTYNNGSNVNLGAYINIPGSFAIIIDGKDTYYCDRTNDPYIGDSSYTTYPFYLQYRGSYYIINFEDGQSHNVEFKFLKSITTTLNEVFIPDTIARVDYVDNQINTHTHDFDTLTNKPFYENITITQLDAIKNQAPGPAAAALSINLTKGEYLVKFNEVEYSIFVDENTSKIESTNLPFTINRSGNEYIGFTWIIQSVDKSTPFTYEISSVERDLK
jgi:hypothetical protein